MFKPHIAPALHSGLLPLNSCMKLDIVLRMPEAHLDEAHISVTKLVIEDFVVLLPHGLSCFFIILKVNKCLQSETT